jgi:hypothetical protein
MSKCTKQSQGICKEICEWSKESYILLGVNDFRFGISQILFPTNNFDILNSCNMHRELHFIRRLL